jgi:branched-chain amino acid transport system permease protein
MRPWPRPALVWLGGLALVLLAPRVLGDFTNAWASDLAIVAVLFVALLGLTILTGYSGQVSLGHGAFMALGGYTTAILVSDSGLELFGHTFSSDLRDVWTIPLAALVAGVAGLLFAVPALRLSGPYLALATFAVAVALPQVLRKAESFTGGGTGVQLFGLPQLTGLGVEATVFGRTLHYNDWLYYLCWGVALALAAAAWLLLRGRTGRALRALRDNELAAAASGVNVAVYKTIAFGVSALYAGVAGALYAMAITFVNPDTFPVTLSILLLVGLVVGGLGSFAPLVAGAAFIQFLPDLSARVSDQPGVPGLVFGAALVAIMLLVPGGAAGLVQRLLAPLTSGGYRRSH